MKIRIKGRELTVDDKLVHAYELAAGKFNDTSATFLLEMDGVEIDSLTDEELEAQLKASMENEVKQMEYLSRPEVIAEAVAASKRAGNDGDI